MLGAAELLAEELAQMNWQPPDFPVVSNVTARETKPEQLQDVLVRQLYSPVRWEQSVEYIANRVDYFVEVGPGKILSGFIRKKARRQLLGNVEDLSSLNRTLEKLKEVS